MFALLAACVVVAPSAAADAAPAPPTLTGSVPASPANDNSPEILGTAAAGTIVTDLHGRRVQRRAARAGHGRGARVARHHRERREQHDDDVLRDRRGRERRVGLLVHRGPLPEVSPPPAAPVVLGIDPVVAVVRQLPRFTGTADAGTTVYLYTDAAARPSRVGIDTAAAFASPGITRPGRRQQLDVDLGEGLRRRLTRPRARRRSSPTSTSSPSRRRPSSPTATRLARQRQRAVHQGQRRRGRDRPDLHNADLRPARASEARRRRSRRRGSRRPCSTTRRRRSTPRSRRGRHDLGLLDRARSTYVEDSTAPETTIAPARGHVARRRERCASSSPRASPARASSATCTSPASSPASRPRRSRRSPAGSTARSASSRSARSTAPATWTRRPRPAPTHRRPRRPPPRPPLRAAARCASSRSPARPAANTINGTARVGHPARQGRQRPPARPRRRRLPLRRGGQRPPARRQRRGSPLRRTGRRPPRGRERQRPDDRRGGQRPSHGSQRARHASPAAGQRHDRRARHLAAGRRVRDTVSCGPGPRDRVLADRRDAVLRDCERVSRR